MAIVEVTPRDTSKSNDDFFEQCEELYILQTTYGDFEPFWKFFNYLLNKPKFASWRGLHMNGATTVIGSKQAKETEAVKEASGKKGHQQVG